MELKRIYDSDDASIRFSLAIYFDFFKTFFVGFSVKKLFAEKTKMLQGSRGKSDYKCKWAVEKLGSL